MIITAPRSAPNEHGGDLQKASQRWGIPVNKWLDLSTAISPFNYPLPTPPANIWQNLPYEDNALIESAKAYYACAHVLPLSGSQQAIEILPHLFRNQSVALPRLGYSEHQSQWQKSDNVVVFYSSANELQALALDENVDIVVVINPNNPTAELLSREYLLGLAARLQKKSGYLIVDEAFIDAQPHNSLAKDLPCNTIILRSIGKFFGLAGIRMGFVLAHPPILEALKSHIGLWPISAPTIWAAHLALVDKPWQKKQIERLDRSSRLLEQQLRQCLQNVVIKRQNLFVTLNLPLLQTQNIFEVCAKQGVLLRQFTSERSRGLLRIGIPSNSAETNRLLDAISRHC